MSDKATFLKHIHYFRAFAIINVAVVHLWYIPSSVTKESYDSACSLVNIVREVVFHDSTIYFIFISGFLFFYLSPKFELKRYYKNKLINVISPYILMTLLVFLLNINKSIHLKFSSLFSIKQILFVFLFGKAQLQYWYIPFISLVFLISPLLLKIPAKQFGRLVVFASFLPLLGTRTGAEVSVWQYIYFFPIYLQGAYIAMNYSNFMAIINTRKKELGCIAVIASLLLIYLHGKTWQTGVFNFAESIYYIQKMSISFLIILAFKRLENKNISVLNNFATYSFAIYFTHTLVGNGAVRNYFYNFFSVDNSLIFLVSVAYLVVIIFTTLFICMNLKRILGKKSRFLIGV